MLSDEQARLYVKSIDAHFIAYPDGPSPTTQDVLAELLRWREVGRVILGDFKPTATALEVMGTELFDAYDMVFSTLLPEHAQKVEEGQ